MGKHKTVTLAIAFVLIVSACNGDHMELPDSTGPGAGGISGNGGPTFDGQIQALFNRRCAFCHNAGSSLPNWLDYDTAYKYRNQIYQKVVVEKSMPMAPYDTMMTDADRKMVADWVNAGAPKNPTQGGSGGPSGSPIPTPGNPPGPGPVPGPGGDDLVQYMKIQPIIKQRCALCHNESGSVPNWMDYNTAAQYRSQIYQRVFVDKTMPPGNTTGITDDERAQIAHWANGDASPSPEPSPNPSPSPSGGPCRQELTAALTEAASLGDVDEVTRLIDDGACPNGMNSSGMTALISMLARPSNGSNSSGFAAIVHELVAFKADVNVTFGGGSALVWAVARDYLEVGRILIENSAKVDTQVSGGTDPYLSKWKGYTPVMLAIVNTDYELAESLLSHGADANIKLADGTSAMNLAQKVQSPAKREALVALLSKYVHDEPGPPSNQLTYTKDILPVFKNRCAVCHNAGSSVPNWLDYDTAYANRDKIFERVVTRKDMPLGNATNMTDEERNQVGQWIQAGAAR